MVDEEFITILEGTRQEYLVPKKYIKELKETEIVLGLGIKELSKYEAKNYDNTISCHRCIQNVVHITCNCERLLIYHKT